MAVDERDLTTPTVAAKYTLGQEIEFANKTTGLIDKYVYVTAHAALTQYAPYVINPASTSGGEYVTAAPATNTVKMVKVGIPQVAFTSSYFGFVKTQGQTTCVASTGLLNAYYGKAINTAAYVVESSTGVTVPGITSFCVCTSATSTGTSATVNLIGDLVSVTT
ncbi:hypothetical protein DRQ25_17590 [Candidatus Fermentibacteria bacterium]|nr:MAG: hypothetical protein DRQ25_17590 [Candidatus Fermentibacteria bacterium]